MEELIKYYKKVEILCKVDIKKIHHVEFDDLYDYYIHKLLVLWNRYQNKHKDSYTFEKLYNADKQFWLYNYLNSSKKRHEISYDVIIDDLGEEEQSYLLEDFDYRFIFLACNRKCIWIFLLFNYSVLVGFFGLFPGFIHLLSCLNCWHIIVHSSVL